MIIIRNLLQIPALLEINWFLYRLCVNFKVKVGDTGELVASLNDQEKPRFTVTGLKPGQEYILDISASNSQGSAPSITITHLTPIDIAEKRLSKNPGEIGGVGVPTYVGVLVGVLSVLLICCITACIMVKVGNNLRVTGIMTL